MSALYPEIEPYDHGMLEVGGGNAIYWESCGNPRGKPALMLHGGPGSGCTRWHRRLFDPSAYRIILFDQRNCGRSTPHASAPDTDLVSNTTANLLDDIETLRRHLDVNRWLLLGGSWGSLLALAYAEAYRERVSEIVLWGATTGRHKEFDWAFRGGVAILFPEQWERLRAALPAADDDGDPVEAFCRLLRAPDAETRERAALAWCTWESATPSWPPAHGLAPRFNDPAYRMAFARIVTHYARNYAWLEDGVILRNASFLAGVPGLIVSGRFDFGAPLGWAWALTRAWPGAKLVVVENAGHDAANEGITRELIRATDDFRNS